MTSWNEDPGGGQDESDDAPQIQVVRTSDSTVTTGGGRDIGTGPADPTPQGRLNNMSNAESAITLASLDTVAGQQTALNSAGYGPLAVDGAWGPKTKAATIDFQGSRGLATDGIWGPATKAAMFAACQGDAGGDIISQLLQEVGLAPDQANVIANNQVNAPSAPNAPILPSASDVAQVHASISASNGVSGSLSPIPVNDVPAATPSTYGQKVSQFYANNKTAFLIGGGVAAVGGVALAMKYAK